MKIKVVKKGGGEEDKKATTKTKVVVTPNRYSAWGELGINAEKEGWYPSGWNNETTEYRNKYDNRFNQVVLPNNQRGYISVIGGNKNGVMDVVIKDGNGVVLNKLLQGVRPEQVDAYFRSKESTIQKRNDSIVTGTNSDRMMPDGSYTPLK